ncbi:MAG: SlyX family protein, partial [Proteobacteria bacterium]|nr:SlyX family protein [Pseudomonadota bacterium]
MNEQQRFEALEIKLMHLEDTIAALGSANAQQQRELAQLRER